MTERDLVAFCTRILVGAIVVALAMLILYGCSGTGAGSAMPDGGPSMSFPSMPDPPAPPPPEPTDSPSPAASCEPTTAPSPAASGEYFLVCTQPSPTPTPNEENDH